MGNGTATDGSDAVQAKKDFHFTAGEYSGRIGLSMVAGAAMALLAAATIAPDVMMPARRQQKMDYAMRQGFRIGADYGRAYERHLEDKARQIMVAMAQSGASTTDESLMSSLYDRITAAEHANPKLNMLASAITREVVSGYNITNLIQQQAAEKEIQHLIGMLGKDFGISASSVSLDTSAYRTNGGK